MRLINSKLIRLYNDEEEQIGFYCEGCNDAHWFRIRGPQPVWGFNGNLNCPSFSPSLRIRYGTGDREKCCHLILKDGIINYCGDCSHDLKGKPVKMVDLPDWLTSGVPIEEG